MLLDSIALSIKANTQPIEITLTLPITLNRKKNSRRALFWLRNLYPWKCVSCCPRRRAARQRDRSIEIATRSRFHSFDQLARAHCYPPEEWLLKCDHRHQRTNCKALPCLTEHPKSPRCRYSAVYSALEPLLAHCSPCSRVRYAHSMRKSPKQQLTLSMMGNSAYPRKSSIQPIHWPWKQSRTSTAHLPWSRSGRLPISRELSAVIFLLAMAIIENPCHSLCCTVLSIGYTHTRSQQPSTEMVRTVRRTHFCASGVSALRESVVIVGLELIRIECYHQQPIDICIHVHRTEWFIFIPTQLAYMPGVPDCCYLVVLDCFFFGANVLFIPRKNHPHKRPLHASLEGKWVFLQYTYWVYCAWHCLTSNRKLRSD